MLEHEKSGRAFTSTEEIIYYRIKNLNGQIEFLAPKEGKEKEFIRKYGVTP